MASAPEKIDVLLKATADAPILQKQKWSVQSTKQMSYIVEFLRKSLKIEPSDSIFVYVNQSFAPSPDQTIANLYNCFGSEGKLILYYAKSQAWG